ncbi:Histone H2B.1 [Spatholobus suberectus]|nr:Histone H2B.1 [Spatholobus suberectus]
MAKAKKKLAQEKKAGEKALAEKKIPKEGGADKKRSKKSVETYKIYIFEVLKQMHPEKLRRKEAAMKRDKTLSQAFPNRIDFQNICSGNMYEGDGDVACDQYHKFKDLYEKTVARFWISFAEEKANKERISPPSSHVINVEGPDTCKTLERGGQGSKNDFHRSASIFIQFCFTQIICPREHRAALANILCGVLGILVSALGNPFDKLSQSISSGNGSQMLSLGQASAKFLPGIIFIVIFIVSCVYTVTVAWSLPFRVPFLSMLCLALLYCLSVLVAAAMGFHVMCGTFRMTGISFASLGVLGILLLLFVLVMLVLFASWRCIKQDGGAK